MKVIIQSIIFQLLCLVSGGWCFSMGMAEMTQMTQKYRPSLCLSQLRLHVANRWMSWSVGPCSVWALASLHEIKGLWGYAARAPNMKSYFWWFGNPTNHIRSIKHDIKKRWEKQKHDAYNGYRRLTIHWIPLFANIKSMESVVERTYPSYH